METTSKNFLTKPTSNEPCMKSNERRMNCFLCWNLLLLASWEHPMLLAAKENNPNNDESSTPKHLWKAFTHNLVLIKREYLPSFNRICSREF